MESENTEKTLRGKRKLKFFTWMFYIVLLLITGLLVYGAIGAEDWVEVFKWLVISVSAAFAGGNSFEHIAEGWSRRG